MEDVRAKKLAELVLDYSVNLQEGDRLLVQFDPYFLNYANLFKNLALKKGAEVKFDSDSFDPKYLRNLIAKMDSNEWALELDRRIELSNWCNARVLVDCLSNPDYAKGIPDASERITEFNREVIGPYKDVLYRTDDGKGFQVKWNLVGFPNIYNARKLNMSLDDYANFVYSATISNDWGLMYSRMKKVKDVFDNAENVRIYVPGQTDLTLSLKGRGCMICDGKLNMPDGENCFGPVEDSLNGKIYFQIPTKREGFGVIEGISLELRNGQIVKYSAEKNQQALNDLMDIDEGVRSIGEFGIGANYGIRNSIMEILFDEKIGGTIHLAVGDSYRELPISNGGGFNKSAIHWDLICDLRRDYRDLERFPGGELYVNDDLVQQDGVWLI